ncbi:MAG: hypothetical protein JWP42_3356 [Pseudomonas sp.]|nr:hypothetical protein [Pseudomonas sp.]
MEIQTLRQRTLFTDAQALERSVEVVIPIALGL